MKISALIPSIADGAVRYGFDPIALFEHQMQIEKMMNQDPLFQNLKDSHKDLVEFSIFDGAAQPAISNEKEINWKAWQERSAQIVHSLGINSDHQVMSEIQKTLESPLLGKSQGIVVGLSQLVPAQLKKDFFGLPLEAKVDILNQYLPAEVISQGFAPAKLGWKDTEISKEEIIARLKESVAVEQRFTVLLVYHYSLQKDLANPKDYLNKWNLDGAQRKNLDQWFNANVAKLIPTEQTTAEPSLVLREIPPVISMFRGFAGNDCATLCSFPFVNSPNEFTFLVYDAKGGIKGYAQGTRVLANGESAFYLHTIAGPRISTGDALNVIKAFVEEKSHLGFSEVLLPPMDKVEGMINFLPVREAIRQVLTSSAESIQYQDSAIRENFKTAFKITKTYDDASHNPLGYKIDESKLGATIKVIHKDSPSLDKVNTQMDKNALIAMFLQMGKSYQRNSAMIEALAPHAGVSGSDVQSLISIAQNNARLSVAELTTKMEATLKEKGFSFKEGYFKKNISIIANGLLNSKDILENRSFAESVLQNLLEQREITAVEKYLLTHSWLFKSETLTVSFLKVFYNDIHEANFKESTALNAALKQNPKAILGNSELLAMLSRSEKAQKVLKIAFLENPDLAKVVDLKAGRDLMQARQQYIELRNSLFKGALTAKNETEYTQGISIKLRELTALGLSPDFAFRLEQDLYVATIDHYLSLKPTTTAQLLFNAVSRNPHGDEKLDRAQRRLIPALLRNAPAKQVDFYLYAASQLKAKSKNPEGIDKSIIEGMTTRADRSSLKLSSTNLFPNLNWGHMTALRCEELFL